MNAIGYVRVSTAKQRDDGVSLDAQQAQIENYCRAHGIEQCEILSDPALSGMTLAARPDALRAIALAKQYRVPIITYSLSRLFRNLVEGVNTLDDLEAAGSGIVSLTEMVDTSSPAGRFTLHILLAKDEFESRQTGERTKGCLGFIRDKGGRVGRYPTTGYRLIGTGDFKTNDDGEIVEIMVQEPDPKEQETIARAMELRAQGLKIGTITGKLTREGHLARSNKPLSRSAVKRIIERGSKSKTGKPCSA